MFALKSLYSLSPLIYLINPIATLHVLTVPLTPECYSLCSIKTRLTDHSQPFRVGDTRREDYTECMKDAALLRMFVVFSPLLMLTLNTSQSVLLLKAIENCQPEIVPMLPKQ